MKIAAKHLMHNVAWTKVKGYLRLWSVGWCLESHPTRLTYFFTAPLSWRCCVFFAHSLAVCFLSGGCLINIWWVQRETFKLWNWWIMETLSKTFLCEEIYLLVNSNDMRQLTANKCKKTMQDPIARQGQCVCSPPHCLWLLFERVSEC